jgi:predicted dithiol-disulfide oxidoreductase (DUF899 family)
MIGTREEWVAARADLLAREKELTRRGDELARERRELPWVPVEEEYEFEGPEGTHGLADLFAGRSQLLVYHLMFGPDDEAACSGCSFTADSLAGAVVHLENAGVSFVAVSRAPLERLLALNGMELHGLSAFALEDGSVYHTYSAFDRGTDVLCSSWQLLDRAPMGRPSREELADWPKRHDEYEEAIHAG